MAGICRAAPQHGGTRGRGEIGGAGIGTGGTGIGNGKLLRGITCAAHLI
jgi:hypothetical protein